MDIRVDHGVDDRMEQRVERSMACGHDRAWLADSRRRPHRARRGRTRDAAPWPRTDRHWRWSAPHASLLDLHARAHHATHDLARGASDPARGDGSRDRAAKRRRPALAAADEPVRMGRQDAFARDDSHQPESRAASTAGRDRGTTAAGRASSARRLSSPAEPSQGARHDRRRSSRRPQRQSTRRSAGGSRRASLFGFATVRACWSRAQRTSKARRARRRAW